MVSHWLGVVAAALLFHALGSFQDGLSSRANGVGYWSWHIPGWLRRDAVIAIWYVIYGVPWWALPLLGVGHAVLHNIVYSWTSKNRWRFDK